MRNTGMNGFFMILVAMFLMAAAVPHEVRAGGSGEWTRDEVKVFVGKAATYAHNHSKTEALTAFSAKEGEFQQGGLYIFAYDFSGNVIAHGGDRNLIGKNLIGLKDPRGVEVIRELVRLARQGSGWLYYTWPNPEHGGSQEPKLGYVAKIDDGWFIGSGTYGSAAIRH